MRFESTLRGAPDRRRKAKGLEELIDQAIDFTTRRLPNYEILRDELLSFVHNRRPVRKSDIAACVRDWFVTSKHLPQSLAKTAILWAREKGLQRFEDDFVGEVNHRFYEYVVSKFDPFQQTTLWHWLHSYVFPKARQLLYQKYGPPEGIKEIVLSAYQLELVRDGLDDPFDAEERLADHIETLFGSDGDACEFVISKLNGEGLKQRFGNFFEWTSKHLSPCEQQVFVLFANDHENKEIACLTGRSGGVVKVLLNRAKSKVRKACWQLQNQSDLRDEDFTDWVRASRGDRVNQERALMEINVGGVCCDSEVEWIANSRLYGYEAALTECVHCGAVYLTFESPQKCCRSKLKWESGVQLNGYEGKSAQCRFCRRRYFQPKGGSRYAS